VINTSFGTPLLHKEDSTIKLQYGDERSLMECGMVLLGN